MTITTFKDYLRNQILTTLEELSIPTRDVHLEKSKIPEYGDLSSNIALTLAKEVKGSPLDLAERIKENLHLSPDYCSAVTISPPGFLNFIYSPKYIRKQLITLLKTGDSYGKTDVGKGKCALVEFVSANPTGPLTVGHGRQAVLGDTVSNILEWHDYDVAREYYFNDAGRQMRLLGESVYVRYMESLGEKMTLPEGGYQGNYIRDIANHIYKIHHDTLKEQPDSPVFKETAEKIIFEDIKSTLEKLGIYFDGFVNEKTFYENQAIDQIISRLRRKNLAYNLDGAVWLKTTDFGKSQDTVLIKRTGEPTYRLPDIAYHEDKIKRGFDLIVDIFGSDHKDTYPDVISALQCLNYRTDHIQVLIHQFVTLKQKGVKVSMSTRKATFVTLDDLIEIVGADVVRYFFLMRNMKSHLNFDMDLAMKESEENPVYYLQYAHARICNILKYGKEIGIPSDVTADFTLLKEPSELNLIKELIYFPEITKQILDSLEPQIISNYLQDIATLFHKFYTECRVVTEDISLSVARIGLVSGVKTVLASSLEILGISRPERM